MRHSTTNTLAVDFQFPVLCISYFPGSQMLLVPYHGFRGEPPQISTAFLMQFLRFRFKEFCKELLKKTLSKIRPGPPTPLLTRRGRPNEVRAGRSYKLKRFLVRKIVI